MAGGDGNDYIESSGDSGGAFVFDTIDGGEGIDHVRMDGVDQLLDPIEDVVLL